MQSILGYGFLLKAPDDYPEGEYQETKAMVENLCKNAWKQCLNAKIEKMNLLCLNLQIRKLYKNVLYLILKNMLIRVEWMHLNIESKMSVMQSAKGIF